MRIRARNLARDWRLDAQRTRRDIQEALQFGREGRSGGLRPEDFSLRDLAAHTIFSRDGEPVGPSFLEEFLNPVDPTHELAEAMSAVDPTAFLNITGQLLITQVLAAYNSEEFVLSKLVPAVPTRLDGEKWPGITLPKDPGDDVTVTKPGEPLKYVGFSEEYVETPSTTKRSLGIAVTKEAIFFDRTGLILQRANTVGEILGLQKEKRLIGVAIGATNNYKEKREGDATAQALNTFYTAAAAGRWANDFASDPLDDWTAIDDAEQAFADTTDPNTGEPIVIRGPVVLTPQSKKLTVERLMTATQLYHGTQLSAGTNYPTVVTVGQNVLDQLQLMVHTSRQLQKQLVAQGIAADAATAKGYWFYGDIRRAFAYMENWPISVVQAPLNSEAEFSQDIVVRFKASERGAAAVIEPRAWQRHKAVA